MTPRADDSRTARKAGATRTDRRVPVELPIHPARIVERLWSENKYALMARSYAEYARVRDALDRGLAGPAQMRQLIEPVFRMPETEISNALGHAYGHLKDYAPDDVRSAIRAAVDTDPDLARELIFQQALVHGDDVLLRSRLFYSPSWFDRLWITSAGTWFLVRVDGDRKVWCRNEDAVRDEIQAAGTGAEDGLDRLVENSRHGTPTRETGRDPWLGEGGALAPLLLVTHLGDNAYANLLPAVTLLRALRFS